jgi:hypothetical protein
MRTDQNSPKVSNLQIRFFLPGYYLVCSEGWSWCYRAHTWNLTTVKLCLASEQGKLLLCWLPGAGQGQPQRPAWASFRSQKCCFEATEDQPAEPKRRRLEKTSQGGQKVDSVGPKLWMVWQLQRRPSPRTHPLEIRILWRSATGHSRAEEARSLGSFNPQSPDSGGQSGACMPDTPFKQDAEVPGQLPASRSTFSSTTWASWLARRVYLKTGWRCRCIHVSCCASMLLLYAKTVEEISLYAARGRYM